MIGSIREYFFLSDARATAKLVPEHARTALHDKLALGRQRSEAADALWSNGHVAEGLRLASQAFEATLEAVAPFEGAVRPAQAPRDAIGDAPTELALEPVEPKAEAGDDEPAAGEASAEADHDAEARGDAAEAEGAEADEEAADGAEAASDAKDEDAEGEAEDDAAEASAAKAEEAPAREAGHDGPAAVALRADARPDEPSWAPVLRRRGLSDGKTREVLEAERTLRAKVLPALDKDVGAAEGELFQSLITARRHVDRVLAPASMTTGQLAWTRASRIGFAAFFAAVAIFGIYLLLKPAVGVEATASAHFNNDFVAAKAIDGDAATEWLLPNGEAGWLDVRITPPQRIDTVRLKNSHNRHYNDRATREYTIDLMSGDRVVRSIPGEFPTLSPRPEWVEHAAGVDDVDHIRINVRSWHRVGGGLADVEWD